MPRLDVRFVNPILGALVDILQQTANLTTQPGTPSLKTDDIARGYITGVISMDSPSFKSSVAISFGEETALALAERTLQKRPDKIDGAVVDMVGELTNMLAGRAAALLNQERDFVKLVLPNIIIGPEHMLAHRVHGPKILLPFTSEIGEIYVEMCWRE